LCSSENSLENLASSLIKFYQLRSSTPAKSVEIFRIPILRDNYTFLLVDAARRQAAAIDPGQSGPVLDYLRQSSLELTQIFITHPDRDHIGGTPALLQKFPQAVVYGSRVDRGYIPGQQVYLAEGDEVSFGDAVGQVLFIPGHTLGHIAYYWPRATGGDLFCGDTIFGGGCGRLKEGTPAQMLASIASLRQLPAETRLWFAHEYTANNLRFALTIEPQNAALQQRYAEVQKHPDRPTSPSTIGLETQTNPFLRWDQPEVMAAVTHTDPVAVFAELRHRKDQF
jgi:hydroxyacylglutathione hydrolase